MRVREVQPEGSDFDRIAEMIKAHRPSGITAAQLRAWHENTTPGRICRRTVAVEGDGRVIGYGVASHGASAPPGHFGLWVLVAPDRRRQGAGSKLYSDLLGFVRSHRAECLTSEVEDDCPACLDFARGRGFEIDGHSFTSALDLQTFDDSPYSDLVAGLQAAGFGFSSIAGLGDTEAARRRVYDLNLTAIEDIPGADGTWMTFEEFLRVICGADWFRPDGQLVAVAGDQLVGLAAVQLVPDERAAYNLMTGVLRPFRRRGIATALKVLAAQYAKEHGALTLRTENDSRNAGMLAINRRLGYLPEAGKYMLTRETP